MLEHSNLLEGEWLRTGEGNAYLSGTYSLSPDLGGGALPDAPALAAPPGAALFLAKFSASGEHLWSRGYVSEGGRTDGALALGGAGEVLVAGGFDGVVDLGTGALTAEGSSNAFLLELTGAGAPVWSARFGSLSAKASAGAPDADGGLSVAGVVTGDLDLGGGHVLSGGQDSLFVARFDAAHAATAARSLGGFSNGSTLFLGRRAEGPIFVGGGFYGELDLGKGITSAGGRDAFVGALAP